MKKHIIIIYTLLLHYSLFAQKSLPEFGTISKADLQLKSCLFEPEATAMNFFDVREIEFRPDNYVSKLITERRVRIKIFKESGYKHASIKIPYYSKKGVTKFKDLSGVIYNLDPSGNIIIQKLEKKDFFKEKAEANLGIINFTFPNVKPGSIIEFRYTMLEKNIFGIDPWIIQDEIPTVYASTILVTPTTSRIKEKIYGADTIDQKKELLTKGGPERDRRTYFRENVKSFQSEPFMSSYKDNLLKIVFLFIPESDFFIDLLTTPEVAWRYKGINFLKSPYFGGQIKKNIPGTEKLIDSAKKISSITQRINFLFDSVQKKAPANPEQALRADDITDAWKDKTGNTTEINLIFLNLLEKADVPCYPLLVSTRNNGKINSDFPSTGQINGLDVLAIDSNKVYVMDASIKNQSFLNPPLNVMNRKAFLLAPGDMKWVIVNDDRLLLRQTINISAEINNDGTIHGNASQIYYDYAKSFMLDSTDEEDEEDRFFDKKTQGLKIISEKKENTGKATDPLVQEIEFSYEPQNSGDFYFINPQFLSFKKENPFTKETRNTDIDLGCNQQFNVHFVLTIPPSYTIEQLPKNMLVRAPDTSFLFKRVFYSDSTQIQLLQDLEIRKAVFDKENYEGIKEFFTRTYALMAEEIVLKKKK